MYRIVTLLFLSVVCALAQPSQPYIDLSERSVAPSASVNRMKIYAWDVGGVTKPFCRMSDGTIVDMALAAGGIVNTNAYFFNVNQFTVTTATNVSIKSGALTTNLSARGLNLPSLTASRAALINAQGDATNSTVTDTELAFLSGTTSSVQNQFAAKQTGSAMLTNLAFSNVVVTSTAGVAITNGIVNAKLQLKTLTGSGGATIQDQVTNINILVTASGTGDFVGPGLSTDNAVMRFDGTTGKLGQNSGVTIDDSANVNTPGGIVAGADIETAGQFSGAALNITGAGTLGSTTTSGGATNLGPTVLRGSLIYPPLTFTSDFVDASLTNTQFRALSGNTTLHLTNFVLGSYAVVILKQDATGTRTVSIDSTNTLVWNNSTNQTVAVGVNTNGNFRSRYEFYKSDATTIEISGPSTAPSIFDAEFSATQGGNIISDTAFGASLNGVTGKAPSQNAWYDYSHIGDTDDDGKPNILDDASTIGSATASSNIAFTITTQLVATNSTVNSNLVMNVDVAVLDLYPTNNISITNFSGLTAGVSKTVTWHIYPQLVNRTVVWPTPGAPGNAVYWRTNANSPMWTTLTNGAMYVLSVEVRNTNFWTSISQW